MVGGRDGPVERSGASERLAARIRDVAGFPTAGVVFADLSALLADPGCFAEVVELLAAPYLDATIGAVAGVEARGFVLAAPLALRLGAGFVPLRKAGKLPGPTLSASYQLEYASATLEVHTDAFAPAAAVLIVDDVLATGGTAVAAAELVRRAGAVPLGLAVLLELTPLGGRARVEAAGVRVHAVLSR